MESLIPTPEAESDWSRSSPSSFHLQHDPTRLFLKARKEMPEFIVGGPDDLPPQLKKLFDRQEMSVEAHRQQLARFYDELTVEQLITLGKLFAAMAGDGSKVAAYYDGKTAGFIEGRHRVCGDCGADHDALPDLQAPPKPETTPASPQVTIKPMVEQLEISFPSGTSMADRVRPADLTTEQTDNMKKYDLEPVLNGAGFITHWECGGCRTPSVSLEDRMLREPGVEGCSGCQQKAKWG